MKLSYLVDTDWAVSHLNKIEKVTLKLKELRPAGIALSVITLAELYEGVCYSKNPAESQRIMATFLSDFPVLGIDEEICRTFGLVRGRLRQEKKLISDFDLLIASTCLRHRLTLLSNNQKHYKMIEGLEIISI